MLRRSYLAAILGLSLCCGQTISASAQQSDGPDGFYEYARNKIGLLRYCRDQAFIGRVTADKAVEAIEIGLRRFAVSDGLVKERGDRAEKAGEAGIWEDASGKRNLASVADLISTSLAGLCRELAGQTEIQPSPAARQPAPKVTPPQARVNVNSLTAATKPAGPPAASTKAVVVPPPPPPPSPPPAPTSPPPAALGPFEMDKWRLDDWGK
jgi:hypothetical protein